MEFDRDREFDRLIDECKALTIPAFFIKELKVTLAGGGEVVLQGDELFSTSPISSSILDRQGPDPYDMIEDVDVMIDVPTLRKTVVGSVQTLLNSHFNT